MKPSKKERLHQNQGATVLGLDLSINGTGWYIEFGRTGKAYGIIKHPPALRHPEYTLDRLFIIARELRDLVASCHMVSIEALAYSAKGRATKDLAGLHWILRLLCLDLGVDYCTPTPQAGKLIAAGKGNASKEEVAKGVKAQWGFEFQDDNQTDAFVMCQIGKAVVSGPPKTFSELQVRALRRKQHLREVKSRRASRAKLIPSSEIFTLAGGGSLSARIEQELTTGPSGPIVVKQSSKSTRKDSSSTTSSRTRSSSKQHTTGRR
jgi:Holliday junction resolvasome RuvABC endonuclease subunit